MPRSRSLELILNPNESSEYGRTRKNYLQWEGDWSDQNAREMIDFIIENDYAHLFYGFELGNEVWVSLHILRT